MPIDQRKLAASGLRLRFLDPVAKRFDSGLEGIEGQRLALQHRGAAVGVAAGVGEGDRGEKESG